MPTSPYAHIEYLARVFLLVRPSSILDIGLGNGKMGFIARDILDVMYGERYHKRDWQVVIDGIEAYEDYIQGHQRYIYNNIYIGDAFDVIDRLGSYDVVVLGDMLEYLPKDKAWLFLDKCAFHSGKGIILNIPLGSAPQPAIYGNDYERHRSEWQLEEIEPCCISKMVYTLQSGMSYGSFLIHKDRYLNLRTDALIKEANRSTVEGRADEAIGLLLYLIRLRPNIAEPYNNLGTVYVERGLYSKAKACFQRAIEINPEFGIAHFNLANTYKDLKDYGPAIDSYLKAIELAPFMHDAAYNLGNLYRRLHLYDEALIAYEMAYAMNPTFAKGYNNMGALLYQKGQFERAIELYKKAIELDPHDADAHWNLALALLLMGNFKEGWPLYEWRWKTRDYPPRTLPMPLWDGLTTDITLLLHAEQGMGDAIHFVRYAPMLKARGLRVVLQCHRELVRLFRTIQDVDLVVGLDEDPPSCDYHCPMMTLPMLFKTDMDSIPKDVPYLSVPKPIKEKWASLVKAGPNIKVGLVWAGKPEYENDHIRSMPLSLLGPLLEIGDVDFYCLQIGEAARQANDYPMLKNLTAHIDDFLDTAGLVERLDLVISVDTAVAHLAGALSRPVWIMLPYCPDWRWMLNRTDSPWYPTAMLFRQSVYGGWQGVIMKVRDELARFVGSGVVERLVPPTY